MKIKTYKSLLLTVGFVVCLSCHVASAQESTPFPAQSPASPSHNAPTFVCLKQDYVDALKSSRVVLDTQITAVLVRFEGDFAVVKRPESSATIYIPKSAILYISAKTEVPIKF